MQDVNDVRAVIMGALIEGRIMRGEIEGMRLVSESNSRDHWAKKAKRVKGQRAVTTMFCRSKFGYRPPSLPVGVKLTRIAPRELDDDNLWGSLKAVRDGVADWLRVQDNNPQVMWLYDQTQGIYARYYAVRLEIMS